MNVDHVVGNVDHLVGNVGHGVGNVGLAGVVRVGDTGWGDGWEAAFGGRPDRVVGRAGGDPPDCWLAAVALGGQGWYARASALLSVLISGGDPVLAALAGAARASHLRQLGGHALARTFDAAGLRRLADADLLGTDAGRRGPEGVDVRGADGVLLDGADVRAARSDVLLGLAADAVGLGRTAEARRLAGIESALGDAGWRAEIRRGWVAAEIELGAGVPEDAVEPARGAWEAAARSGSVRHRVKSALVLGAAVAGVGKREEAHELVLTAQADAARFGLRPLAWPCAMVLADIDPSDADSHRDQAARELDCVLLRADPIARALAAISPWVPTWLLDG